MSCPICGANCKCRKRGPGGLCCDCHRHKARPVRVTADESMDSTMRASLAAHLERAQDLFQTAKPATGNPAATLALEFPNKE